MEMISYASLERVEEGFAVCEVEKIHFLTSVVGDFTKDCFTANIPVSFFTDKGIAVENGNVYTVKVQGEEVKEVVCYEEDETRRRKEWMELKYKDVLWL